MPKHFENKSNMMDHSVKLRVYVGYSKKKF